jgi:hypothetical protein
VHDSGQIVSNPRTNNNQVEVDQIRTAENCPESHDGVFQFETSLKLKNTRIVGPSDAFAVLSGRECGGNILWGKSVFKNQFGGANLYKNGTQVHVKRHLLVGHFPRPRFGHVLNKSLRRTFTGITFY